MQNWMKALLKGHCWSDPWCDASVFPGYFSIFWCIFQLLQLENVYHVFHFHSWLLSALSGRLRGAKVQINHREGYSWHIYRPYFHFEPRLLNLKESFCTFLLSQIQMSLSFQRTVLNKLSGQKAVSPWQISNWNQQLGDQGSVYRLVSLKTISRLASRMDSAQGEVLALILH